jgi:hypothetical protein
MTAIARPKHLTGKAWRANKGLFTKAVTDATGLGKALDKLDERWNAVPWDEVDPEMATANLSVRGFDSTYTTARVDELKQRAGGHAQKVEALKKQLLAVGTLAGQTSVKWKKNKLVPASSVKHVGLVQSAAQKLLTQLNELDDAWTARRQGAEVSEKLIRQKVNSQIGAQVRLLRGAAQDFLEAPAREHSVKLYDAVNTLIPLLAYNPDRAHQAARARLMELLSGEGSRVRRVKDEALKTEAAANSVRQYLEAVRAL